MTDTTPAVALAAALALALPEIEGAAKDSANPAFKTKYADLSSVVAAVKPALTHHGLFFIQLTHEQQGGVCVETQVHHREGGCLSFGKLFVPATKQDAQGYGSALTYARRYALMTAFGVCPEDDDGNAAAQSQRQRQPERQTATRQQSNELSAQERIAKWVEDQIKIMAAFKEPVDFDKLTALRDSADYQKGRAAVQKHEPKLFDKLTDAERGALQRTDDVPF